MTRAGKTPKYQDVQIIISVRAPRNVIVRLAHQFFLEALEAILLEEDVPGVKVHAVIWTRDRRTYEYYEDDAIEALKKAVQIFGLQNIVKSIKTSL